jgi:hypothetical protein
MNGEVTFKLIASLTKEVDIYICLGENYLSRAKHHQFFKLLSHGLRLQYKVEYPFQHHRVVHHNCLGIYLKPR